MPNCRQCPSNDFELSYYRKSRYMAICHAVECILNPRFPENKVSESQFISRANVRQAAFTPLYNCPHLVKLRNEGKIITTIDFLNE